LYYNAPDRLSGIMALSELFASCGISFVEITTDEIKEETKEP